MTPIVRGWRRLSGAILFLVALTGCSLVPPSSAGPAASVSPASSATAATPAPAETLASALATIRPAAEFETTVTVDGTVVLTSTGRSYADASTQSVTSQGRTVEYVHVPPGAWARDAGGAWVLVTADQAPGSPLDVLAAPSTVQRSGTSATSLIATYPAEALGLTGDPVTVSIEIDGTSITFRYETTVGERTPASSVTVLRPSTSSEPIVPPVP